jgi:two-component system cell cycle sensor histidine kinase/response regulator CckA
MTGGASSRALPDHFYRELFDDAVDAILVLDDNRLVIEANAAAGQLVGLPRASLAGRPLDSLMPDDGAALRTAWPELVALGEAALEQPVRAGPSATRLVEFRFRSRGGRHVCVARDVTEQRAIEERLAQSEKIESVGRLAGGIAHDFNNLLTAILGYTELLHGQAPAGSKQQADLVEIQKAGRRASALVHQLLAFSRRQVLMPKDVDLNDVVSGLQGMLRRLIREDITLACDLADEPAVVTVDPGQMEQVIVNLVLNARDALPGGGRIRIDVAVVQPPAAAFGRDAPPRAPRYVRVRVTDDGVGIGPDVLPHVFEPFFTTKGLGEGTGLGLASAYGTVRQSQGHIAIESALGRGTAVTMHFPMAEARCGEPGAEPTDGRPVAEGPGRASILVVEDEDAVRTVVGNVLRRHGFRVLEAATPALALEIFAGEGDSLDLLLLDVVMPGMNGPALAQRFIAERPDSRILFISGYLNLTATLTGGNPNVGFLGKPFSASALVDRVRDMLAASAAG